MKGCTSVLFNFNRSFFGIYFQIRLLSFNFEFLETDSELSIFKYENQANKNL